MRVLVGSTGFVGATLARVSHFDLAVHRPDLDEIRGVRARELVCAGLPAAKYLANADPEGDWRNVTRLAGAVAEVEADRAVLVSTVDVYDRPVGVDESAPPAYDGAAAYGRNRAWFEAFVRAHVPEHVVLRLPALYGTGLRKNLVFDLLEGRADQWARVNGRSTFQFFDVARTWDYAVRARAAGLRLVNLATEPVTAQAVADLFDVVLPTDGPEVHYDVRTRHAGALGGANGYLVTAAEQLGGIAALRCAWSGRSAA